MTCASDAQLNGDIRDIRAARAHGAPSIRAHDGIGKHTLDNHKPRNRSTRQEALDKRMDKGIGTRKDVQDRCTAVPRTRQSGLSHSLEKEQ